MRILFFSLSARFEYGIHQRIRKTEGKHNTYTWESSSFLSAAKPTDQGEEGVVLLVVVVVVVVVGGFGGTVFRSPMYNQNGCIQRKLFLKMGASKENFS